MFSRADGVSLFNYNCVCIHIKGKELLHHSEGFGISHNLYFRISSYHFFYDGAVVRLHVVHDDVVQFPFPKDMLQILKKLSAYSLVNGVQKHGLLVQDHIGVVGYPSWNGVNIFKQGKSSVTRADPV